MWSIRSLNGWNATTVHVFTLYLFIITCNVITSLINILVKQMRPVYECNPLNDSVFSF